MKGINENSYGHALLQRSATPSYENAVPRTYTRQKNLDLRPCKQLKKELAKLKYHCSALPVITYLSSLLRSKLKTAPSVSNKQPATDKYDYDIGRGPTYSSLFTGDSEAVRTYQGTYYKRPVRL